MVTDTAPKEPEADTPSGAAGGLMISETVPKTPEADTEERRTTVLYRSEETNVIDPITEGMAGLTKGETWGPSW
jgi:hypothetical protein